MKQILTLILPLILVVSMGVGCVKKSDQSSVPHTGGSDRSAATHPTTNNMPPKQEKMNEMIPEARAVEIARDAVKGKIKIPDGNPVNVELIDGRYVVTFPTNLPKGIRGASYYAKVTINAKTGEVIEILGGS
jgi:uncharacterized membrane protein YkoI